MASSTGSGGVEKNVAIVYTVEGVDQATADQERLAGALGETSEALGESATAAARAEQATERMGTAALEAGQQAILTQQRISALAAGLSGLGSALGSDSEVGSVLGRMGQLAATGVSIGSIFGPGGAVVGGILGAALPALQSLGESLGIIGTAQDEAATAADAHAASLDGVASSAERASAQIRELNQRLAERATAEQLTRIRSGQGDLTEQEQRMRAELLRERQRLADREGGTVAEIFGGSGDEAEILESLIASGQGSAGPRARGSRGGGRRGPSQADILDALMRGRGGDDALSFASGLGEEGPPSAGEIESARGRGRARTGSAFGAQRGAEQRAQRAAIEQLDRLQKEKHDLQMQRIQEQVDAWAGAGQKIGATLYNAFQIAATGQESLDVAVVKGFKNLAIQFGGQMVNEGIGALFTAIGNTVANPPMAATKAAEGAGKLALGIGLGAAGAAIPVPASGGGAQASTPRLGPQGSGETGGARSVVVNMNAPSVVTGTRAVVGREIGRALDDASLRFGRRMSA